mmetsp:Transcript_25135/g.58873  ORF Transcript_25135/g.58873 Transcript_25135/m.58873 type:complete len:298 (-) Transcript_25135:1802-2695(-)
MSSGHLFSPVLSASWRFIRPQAKKIPSIRREYFQSMNSAIFHLSRNNLTTLAPSLPIGTKAYFLGCSDSSGFQLLNPKLSKSPKLIWHRDRTFASRRRGGSKVKNSKNNRSLLANEELVSKLIRNAGESSADKVTVRLVIDGGPDTPSSVQIITLSNAITLSLDRELDLIGANLDGDPPVIRASQLAKLEYKHKQAQKKIQQSSSNKKERKSFRFKAGIESNDLERKLDRIKEFLSRGHDCEFTVFARLRTLRQNPNAGSELVELIRTLLSDHGDMKRAPQTNETKSFYRVQYQPKK